MNKRPKRAIAYKARRESKTHAAREQLRRDAAFSEWAAGYVKTMCVPNPKH